MKKEKLKDSRRQRKILVLPLVIIPFLTMAFWAMGGGSGKDHGRQNNSGGLNLQLPNAQLKDDRAENKMSYYEAAEQDSVKFKKGREEDPFYASSFNDPLGEGSFHYDPGPLQGAAYKDTNEQKVYRKLAELNRHLQTARSDEKGHAQLYKFSSSGNLLEKNVADSFQGTTQNRDRPDPNDPEVDQLNEMMDRILDIQHPERVRQKLEENSPQTKEHLFPVSTYDHSFTISLLDTSLPVAQANPFYSLERGHRDSGQNAIEAFIDQSQTLVNGSIIKIRLADDVVVEGSIVPKGNFVFGKTSLEGERLHIDITAIRNKNSVYAVKLTVYDLDGMEGIHIPGSITRDVAGQSADNSLQQIQMGSFDPSIKVQATTAGINAAKTLLARKAKLVKVTVKAGYKILLKANNH